MPANGFLVSSRLARTLAVFVFGLGVWVATIEADLGNKAEKIDVATQVATQTETLKSIAIALSDIKDSVKSIDERQRKSDIELAKLKAKAEAEKK